MNYQKDKHSEKNPEVWGTFTKLSDSEARKKPAILGLRQEYTILLEKAPQPQRVKLSGTPKERVDFASALPKGGFGEIQKGCGIS